MSESELNPYAPPEAPLAQAQSLRRATRLQRFGTLLLDTIFFYLFAIVIGIVLALLGIDGVLQKIPDMLVGGIILLAYYAPQEAFSGRTLGKRIMGTQVVNADGDPITGKQAVLRTLCRMIPFEAFSFLFLSPEDRGPRGWHDSIPNTIVVTTREG